MGVFGLVGALAFATLGLLGPGASKALGWAGLVGAVAAEFAGPALLAAESGSMSFGRWGVAGALASVAGLVFVGAAGWAAPGRPGVIGAV